MKTLKCTLIWNFHFLCLPIFLTWFLLELLKKLVIERFMLLWYSINDMVYENFCFSWKDFQIFILNFHKLTIFIFWLDDLRSMWIFVNKFHFPTKVFLRNFQKSLEKIWNQMANFWGFSEKETWDFVEMMFEIEKEVMSISSWQILMDQYPIF